MARLPMASTAELPLIAHKELIPIVIASFVWGKSWEEKIVQFNSDNQAVVTILTRLYC